MLSYRVLLPALSRVPVALALLALPLRLTAAEISAARTGLAVQVDAATGTYRVVSQNPPWIFAGSLGGALTNVATGDGQDAAGPYHVISFAWSSGAIPLTGRIQLYSEKPLALFTQTCGAATPVPPPPFPDFTNVPSLHVFSYGHHEFAPPRFAATEISTPWLLFDDQANSFVISPASHFMVASMTGDGHGEVASGFNAAFHNVPAGFTQQTVVACGHGINAMWDTWGHALLAWQGGPRPANDADTVLKYLGYWTDNGAFYYYNYDLAKGYANTLLELTQRYQQEQIPIRYLQLDSWWYYKTTTGADGVPGKAKKVERLPEGEWNRYGGLLAYTAHKDLFTNGLAAFQKEAGLPLVTHSRWIDPASPYHQKYKISGIAAVDPQWWDDIADYMKASGIVTYEQDWLDRIFTYSPAFSSDLGTGEAFLDNMARACQERGITVQYCMPYPCHFLQGSHYANLTSIRTSEDRLNTNKWNDFLYTSRLAVSMGIWPWTDVFMSGEIDNLLVSTLSAGPVGIGDALGAESKVNLLQSVRADGVIVKPDSSIIPLDQTYLADANKAPAPMVASAYTDRDGVKTAYVFAFNRHKTPPGKVHFNLGELGVSAPAYVYDYFSGTGRRVSDGTDFSAPLARNQSVFYVVAPVGESGLAFLGDQGKFVGTGKERVRSLLEENGRLTAGLVLAEGETSVVLHGFAPAQPVAAVRGGHAGAEVYDPQTGHFSVTISVDPATPLDTVAGDPVREMTVTLATPVK